ncbi:biotin/lipoyl-containing protein [Stakelama saccharophila]|uniref:Biotin/lipoyl-containing protein n=1 Tax=Stakelama saccharophila TaxID=3075605 RepID=A0ABZ0BAU6_9SPHN|nr:biotin/lipoyl-containing protein [Stakelama sp. W311]WNO54190.1 biotin/lipoyl-containing protein [Stakelama sp. W311]
MLDRTSTPPDAALRRAIVTMPRLNANEDEARIAAIGVAAEEVFERDAVLFTVETTKAANDVLAPCSGRVARILVQADDMVAVGAPVCELWLPGDARADDIDFQWADEAGASPETESRGSVHISAKARLRAEQLGVAIEAVAPRDGRVRIEDVERHAEQHRPQHATPPGKAPALLQRYGAASAVIVGGSGHARAVLDALGDSGYTIVGALDATIAAGTAVTDGLSVLGKEDLLEQLRDRGVRTAFVGVGGATSNAVRKRVFERLVAAGFHLPPIVAASARLGRHSSLGAATYLFPGANVGPSVVIGDDCIINQNAVIAHDSAIGDHVHLAPNAVVAGHCRIGDGATLGMCATLLYGAAIGRDCLVHNTVAVAQDMPDGTVLSLANASRHQPRGDL